MTRANERLMVSVSINIMDFKEVIWMYIREQVTNVPQNRKRGKAMRKLPNGISNYEKLIEENRIYVDKTMYIEKMENLSDAH